MEINNYHVSIFCREPAVLPDSIHRPQLTAKELAILVHAAYFMQANWKAAQANPSVALGNGDISLLISALAEIERLVTKAASGKLTGSSVRPISRQRAKEIDSVLTKTDAEYLTEEFERMKAEFQTTGTVEAPGLDDLLSGKLD
jgi:hypothetical protein